MGEEIIFKTPEDVKGDGTPCSSIRQELKFCIRNTDCVKEVSKRELFLCVCVDLSPFLGSSYSP